MFYYIADTILFSINNRIFNELFKFIEIIFIKYGLCLNKNKYVLYQFKEIIIIYFISKITKYCPNNLK